MTEKNYGPAWQIEQNIKNYEGQAQAFRADSARYLVKASEAEAMADQYKRALEVLKNGGIQ